MNLKLMRWLLAHRELLQQIIEIVKSYKADSTLIAKWTLVDKLARLIIPVVTAEDLRLLKADWDDDYDTVGAFAIGTEYAALGIDWELVVKILLPILEIIIKALSPDE